jgi:hypothetical protein
VSFARCCSSAIASRETFTSIRNPVADGENVYFDGSTRTGASILRARVGAAAIDAIEGWPASRPAIAASIVGWVFRGDPPQWVSFRGVTTTGEPTPIQGHLETNAVVTDFVGTADGAFFVALGGNLTGSSDPAGVFQLGFEPPKQIGVGRARALAADENYVAFVVDNKLQRLLRRTGRLETLVDGATVDDVALSDDELVYVENGAVAAVGGARGRRTLVADIAAMRVVADERHVYATTPRGVLKITRANGASEMIHSGLGLTALAIDRCAVYWVSDGGMIRHVK